MRAPIVVVAAGALHSPALLLRSGLDLPAIGRNLFLHPTSAIAGIYEERIESWSGPPQTVICDHFSQLSPGYGFRIEAVPAHPGLLALALPWFGARDHRRYMQQAAHICALIVLVRDRVGGKVEVARDGRLSIKYQPGLEERVRLAQGIEATLRIHAAAGARGADAADPAARRPGRDGARAGRRRRGVPDVGGEPASWKLVDAVQRPSDGHLPHGPRSSDGCVRCNRRRLWREGPLYRGRECLSRVIR